MAGHGLGFGRNCTPSVPKFRTGPTGVEPGVGGGGFISVVLSDAGSYRHSGRRADGSGFGSGGWHDLDPAGHQVVVASEPVDGRKGMDTQIQRPDRLGRLLLVMANEK